MRWFFLLVCFFYLTADAESLQWVEAEPARVACLFEAVHKFGVERPLQGRESHQEHMLLLGGQLVPQDIMTSSGIMMMMMMMRVFICLKKKKAHSGGSGGLTSARSPPAGCEERGSCTSSAGRPQECCPHTARSKWAVQTCC